MSRIGKKPVPVPAGVKVTVSGNTVTIAGAKQTLTLKTRPEIKVAWNESEKSIVVTADQTKLDDSEVLASWGSTRAHLKNMVEGVIKGYEETMEVVGVGWTAALQGKNLKLVVGYANPLLMPIPTGIEVTVDKQFVKIKGADKQAVGEFAAEMRAKRKPEPYNGKGIKYVSETIKRKQGKTFGTTAG